MWCRFEMWCRLYEREISKVARCELDEKRDEPVIDCYYCYWCTGIGGTKLTEKEREQINKIIGGGVEMIWKHKRITELTGGSLSGNMVTVANAVNANAYVLEEAVQKIEELSIEIERLKERLERQDVE